MRILYLDCGTLRPDHLGAYGYHRSTSPNIDRLAQEGVHRVTSPGSGLRDGTRCTGSSRASALRPLPTWRRLQWSGCRGLRRLRETGPDDAADEIERRHIAPVLDAHDYSRY